MSTLDDKLRKIRVFHNDNDLSVALTDKAIAQIKEAFTEANWFDVTTPEFQEALLKTITLGDVTVTINGKDIKLEENHE